MNGRVMGVRGKVYFPILGFILDAFGRVALNSLLSSTVEQHASSEKNF